MFGGDEGDFREDPYERQMRLHRERENASKPKAEPAPALISVVTSLPGLPEGWTPPSPNTDVNPNQWQDKVIEPMPVPNSLLEYQIGETWFIRLPGGSALSKVKISDLTAKTVEFSNLYSGYSRYIRTEIEFVERV